MKRSRVVSVVGIVLVVTAFARPAPSIVVSPGASSLPVIETFSTPQGVFDPYAVGSLAEIGESFAGQVVTISGGFGSSPNGFESVSGSPSGPLSLQTAQSGGVITWTGSELQGLLSDTDLAVANVGEGAISILFSDDQLEMGLDLLKGNDGTVTMEFYERSGALFDSVSFSISGDQAYTFQSEDGVSRFAGVTITNVDNHGIAIDDLRLNGVVIPAPSAILLGTLGASMVGLWRRRRTF